MGIPTFFRNILQKNNRVIRGASPETMIDYFFIDFNSIIYFTWAKIQKSIPPSMDSSKIHKEIIDKTVNLVIHMVNNIVQPKQYVYISMDGCAPRAKMVQQRSRRYKSVQWKEILKSKKAELGMVPEVQWDPSPNICPGTEFMQELSEAIRHAMKHHAFQSMVLLSDSNVPGEGEHKFLQKLKSLRKHEKTRDSTVAVYSPDGDMISLCLLTHKKNINIMRIPDPKSIHEKKYCEEFEYIYCDLNAIRDLFMEELTTTYHQSIDPMKVLCDYNFLLFMVGNDFVPSLPFLKIRHGGLDTLIRIYNELRPKFNDYLILYDVEKEEKPIIHAEFFEALIQSLSMIENREMSKQYSQCLREAEGEGSKKHLSQEKDMTPIEIFESRYQHLSFFHPDHPDFEKNLNKLNYIKYSSSKHEWKADYYRYFLGIDPSHFSTYNESRTEMVKNYFESLVFTLHYYLIGCPSYTWYYKYRVSPIPSDMFTILNKFKFNINSIQFKPSEPYPPFVQLMLILPPQMKSILPHDIGNCMFSSELKRYYPTHFEVDILAGLKYIYSEAILKEIPDEDIIKTVTPLLNQLTEKEKKRNEIQTKIVYSKKK